MEGFFHVHPAQDALAIDPGNPRRCLRSIKWKKAMEGFFHVHPAQDALAIDPGNPWRCLRSIKWKKAMEGFFHGHPAPVDVAGRSATEHRRCTDRAANRVLPTREQGLGPLTGPRSPGREPGDSGHDNHPAVHAA